MRNLFAVPAPVSRLQIEITTGCNLRCVGCQRTIGMNARTWRNAHMPRERFEAVLRNAPAARMLVLQGIGEPTLHPDLDLLIGHAHATGRFGVISFNTNALVRELGEYERLRSLGLGHVSVSVDSLVPETAEALRAGTDVGRLREAIVGLGRLFPNMTVSVVLSRRNLPELPSLLIELAGLGVRVVEIQPLISYAASSGALTLDTRDAARARELIEQARRRLPGTRILAAPSLTPDGSRCKRPFHALYVTVDGQLTPCCTTNDTTLFGHANLAGEPLERAWQQPKVVAWLSRFIDAEPQICVGCTFNPSGAGVRRPPLSEGISLQMQGHNAEAEAIFASIAKDPDSVEALHRLGLAALQRGAPAQALPLLDAARTLADDPRIAHNCCVALSRVGRRSDAIALARETLRVHAAYLPGYGLLAALLADEGQPQAAVDVLALQAERALKAKDRATLDTALDAIAASPLQPSRPTLLANLLRVAGHETRALQLLERRLASAPDDIEAGLTQAMTRLPIVYRSEQEIDERRAHYERELRRVEAIVRDAPADALAAAVGVVGRAKPFFLAYQGHDDRELQQRYGRTIARIAAASGRARAYRLPAPPQSRIRVGFATRFFHMHSVSKLFAGWIEGLDRSRFEPIGYHLGTFQDATVARIAAACSAFRGGEHSVDAWCRSVLDDAPHVLIYLELGMDELAIQLACHRLAPVQCVTWGHPVTTGLPDLDYFLSSALMEPDDGERHYTETLIRLPHLSIAYNRLPDGGGTLTRAALGLRMQATVFVCCQSLFKYLPRYDQVFVEIAQRTPDAQFLFIGDPAMPATAVFRDRVFATFRAAGLAPERHVVIVAPVPFEAFPSFLRCGDVYLDSIGWSGGNTTLEALACDLPVVTMPTGLMRGRHSAAILRRIGMQDTIAASLDDYVGLAAALADPQRRAAMRERVLAGREALYGDAGTVRALESFMTRAVAKAYGGAAPAAPGAQRRSPASQST